MTTQAQSAVLEYTPRAQAYDISNNSWHATLADDFISWTKPQPGMTVLDLACGTGLVSTRMASAVGLKGVVIGVDITTAMLDIARSKLPRPKDTTSHSARIEYIECDICSPNLSSHPSISPILESGGFDIISLCSALILLPPMPTAHISFWKSLLKPQGRMIIDVPTEHRTMQYLATEVLGRKIGVDFPFTRSWIKGSQSLVKVMEDAGLKVERTIVTESYLPVRVWKGDQGEEVFETEVLAKFGARYIGMGPEVVQKAREAWRELWEETTREEGEVRDGHWLYVCIARRDGS